MKGCDCLILSQDGVVNVAAFAKQALDAEIRVATLTVTDLSACAVEPGAEMGTLIVPFNDATELAPVHRAVSRCREMGGKIAVLGLAATCAQAGGLKLGDFFDTLVSVEWAAAPEIIRRFVESHRTHVQNRAFRAYLDTSVDGYWIWQVESDRLEWSRRTSEMIRSRPEDAPNSIVGFKDLVHPHDRDRVEQAIRNHLQLNAPYKNIEMRMRTGDGSYGHFVANGQALRDEEGHAIIFVGSLTDRTLMQKVERQLEDTQKRFTVLFHHMNDAAVLADVDTGLILEANQPAERLWGKSIAELVGAHQTELHPPNLSDTAKQAFADHIAALMQNKRDTINVPILRADGTEVPAEISSSLIEFDGRTTILGVFRDISDRVRAERDIRERDAQIQLSSHLASMGTLAAGVAHEINNPLTYVLGNLELVKSLLDGQDGTMPDVVEAIEAAATGGRYVREIVADLKSISRIDASDDTCDPCEVIRIASRMAMSDLRHRAQLDMALGDAPMVPISSARLSQVILNILSNATRAFHSADKSHNRIGIEVRHKDDTVQIAVVDNGTGIAASDLARVWEPFFTKSGESGGTGLGLSICRRILNEANGALEIDSVLGEGTCVTVTLPATPVPANLQAGPAGEMAVASPGARPRVMAVDDDSLVTTLIARMLEKDFEVTVFNDAREALAALQAGMQCDVILCDIMMPEMDGRAFHAAVDGRLPFLFLTGGAVTAQNIAFERRMAAEGRLMHKPFDSADLRRKLRGMCAALSAKGETGFKSEGRMSETDKDQAGRPEPGVLDELEDLLGRDVVRLQFQKLLDQIQSFEAQVPGMPAGTLAEEAHKIAGAADVMGLRAIGGRLRGCQRAAAQGDMDSALAEVEAVRPLQRDFESFISGY